MPQVSVIVPNYNGRNLLPRTVDSLCGLRIPAQGLEILLIDDGSTDGSRAWLEQQSLPEHFHLLFHEKNRGRSAARNTGLKVARGEMIVFLDGDLTCTPDLVLEHLDALSAPGVHAVAGHVKSAPGTPRTRVNRYLYESSCRGARQFHADQPLPFQYLLTNNMSIRRRVLDSGIRFSEEFDGYGGEDTLFAWQVQQRCPNGLRYASGAVACDHDVHELDLLINKFSHYGRINLPRLLEKIPQEQSALRADWVLGSGYRSQVSRWIFSPLIRRVVRSLWPAVPVPCSDFVVRYLLAAAVMGEFQQAVRSRQGNPAS